MRAPHRQHKGLIASLQAHADALALGLVLLIAIAIRVSLHFRAPVLVMGDSETYLSPAAQLLSGAGFDLALKRTPGYPLFIAAVLAIFGADLHALTAVQHGLGVGTAALTFFLARLLAGPLAGLLAGTATAVAGNLLVYERLVMTETLFTSLLLAFLASLTLAARLLNERAALSRDCLIWLLVAGAALGLAALVRPVAQALLVVIPLGVLLGSRRWRSVLQCTLVFLLGYALVLAPWTFRAAFSGETTSVGALGQTLVGRTARHDRREPAMDRGFVFYDPQIPADPDPTRLAARKMLQDAANRGSSGRAVHTRLKRELALSDEEADRLMRDLAFEAISRRAGYYVSGSIQRFGRLWVAGAERLSSVWSDQPTIRREWEDPISAPLLADESALAERELSHAERLTRVFQPGSLGWVYPALFLLGLAAAVGTRACRFALLPGLAAVLLIALSAALVGGVARYRYPEDPLIFTVIAAGLTCCVSRVWPLLRKSGWASA